MKPQCWSTWPVIPSFSCVTGPCWTRSAFPCAKGHHLPGGAPAGQTAERIEQLEQEITELMGSPARTSGSSGSMRISTGRSTAARPLFELSAVMGKAFVQRLRLTGLRLWLNPRHFQLSGPEQRFLAQGKQLEQLLGQRLPGTGLLFRSPQPEREAGAVFGNDVLVNSVALMRLGSSACWPSRARIPATSPPQRHPAAGSAGASVAAASARAGPWLRQRPDPLPGRPLPPTPAGRTGGELNALSNT